MELSAGSERGHYQGERQTQNPDKKNKLGPFRLIDTAAARSVHSRNIEELRRGETNEGDERNAPADIFLKKKHTSAADLEKIKEQLDSFIKRIYASCPDETASFFEERLSEIEARIEEKWTSRAYAPNHVTQLVEEVRSVIERSGSLSALRVIRGEMQDMKGNLNRVIELEVEKQNLLELIIPKFDSCKKKINDFGKHPISEEVIKSKLFDLLTAIEESKSVKEDTPCKSVSASVGLDSPAPNVQEQLHVFESALNELRDLKSEVEDLKSFKETSLQVQSGVDAHLTATSDGISKETEEAFTNRLLMESALEELRGLKGAMEALASKQHVTPILMSAEEALAAKVDRADGEKRQEVKNDRLQFLEQQIGHLLEKTDILSQSVGDLSRSEETETPDQEEYAPVERLEYIGSGRITNLKKNFLRSFSEYFELLSHNISRFYQDNSYKLAVVIAFPVSLILILKILDFSSVNVQNLGERAALEKSASVSVNHSNREKSTREKLAPKQQNTQTIGAEKMPAKAEVVSNSDDSITANQKNLADFDKAQLYFKSKEPDDIARALEAFEKLALSGFTQAQYKLGLIYEGGEKVKRNYNEARKWYLLAANRGSTFAMHNLASLIAEGKGGEQSYSGAATWFEKAASQGMRDSQYNLGIIYAKGLGVTKDLVKSQQWFAAAAKQGDPEAAKKQEEISRLLEEQGTMQRKSADNIYASEPKMSARNPSALPPEKF